MAMQVQVRVLKVRFHEEEEEKLDTVSGEERGDKLDTRMELE